MFVCSFPGCEEPVDLSKAGAMTLVPAKRTLPGRWLTFGAAHERASTFASKPELVAGPVPATGVIRPDGLKAEIPKSRSYKSSRKPRAWDFRFALVVSG